MMIDRDKNLDALPEEIGPLLSAYVDGELEPAEVARIEALLEGSEELRLRLADERALSAALSTSLDQLSEAVSFEGFADSVIARIRQHEVRAQVSPRELEASPGERASPRHARAEGGALGRLFGGLFGVGGRRMRFAFGAATVAMLALLTAPTLFNPSQLFAYFDQRLPLPRSTRAAQQPKPGPADGADVLSVEAAGDYETMLIKTTGGTTIIYVQEAQ